MSYTIKGIRETGTITYHCSTAGSTLEKFQDFQKAAYCNIEIVTGDDCCVAESTLVSLAHYEQIGPVFR